MVRAIEDDAGVLVFDDTIQEEPYSDENELISWPFDPSKNRTVKGISLLNRVHHAQGVTPPVACEPSLPTQRAAPFEDAGAATRSESLRRPSLPAETTRGFRPYNGAPDDPASGPRLAAGLPERPSAAPLHRHHPRLRQRSARRLRRPSPCPQKRGIAMTTLFSLRFILRPGTTLFPALPAALAGAFVVLALGVLAAPVDEAQTALPGLTASPVSGSTDKLDVSWNAWTPKPDHYLVRWKTGSQSYDNTRKKQVNSTPSTNPTSTQITDLTANTAYDVEVRAISGLGTTLARSETSATTNATAVVYQVVALSVAPTTAREGTTYGFNLSLVEPDTTTRLQAPPGGLTVNLTISDATTGGDFLAPANEGAQTVTFAEGESTATYSVPTVDDNQDEPNGQIILKVVAGAGYTTSSILHTLGASVRDNDEVDGLELRVVDSNLTLGTNRSSLDIGEAGGRQKLTVTAFLLGTKTKWMTRSSDTVVSLSFAHTDTVAGDFTALPGSTVLTIPAGKTYGKKVLYIEPKNDSVGEGLERFSLSAIASEGATELASAAVTMYLVDPDWGDPIVTIAPKTSPVTEGTAAEFTVTLRSPAHPAYDWHGNPRGEPVAAPTGGLTIKYGVSWSNAARVWDSQTQQWIQQGSYWNPADPFAGGESIHVAAGQSTATISVPTHDDSTVERDGFVGVALVGGSHYKLSESRNTSISAKVKVVDDDGGSFTSFTVAPVSGDGTKLNLSWSSVPGANGYVLEWKSGDERYSSDRRTVVGNVTSRQAVSLSTDTTYTYRITALDTTTDPDTALAQAEASGTTSDLPAVANFTVTPVSGDGTKLDLSWNAVSGADDYWLEWKSGDQEYSDGRSTILGRAATSTRHTSLSPGTTYTYRLTALDTSTDPDTELARSEASGTTASAGEGGGAPPGGVGSAPLTGLNVASVSGEPSQLAVNWDAVQGAATYSVRWKTGSGDYGDAEEASTNSHTVTGLSPGTTYTVNVAALDADNTLLAEGVASGTTVARTGKATTAATFTIYHDPSAAATVSRYDTAVGLLKAAGLSYAVRSVTGTGKVDRLAGVTYSVMPRFFLGDPEATGWGPAQAKVNNGGLRWLRSKIKQVAVPALSVADASAQESSGSMSFAVSLSAASDVSVSVDYVTADGTATSGADYTAASGTLTFAAGETSKTVMVTLLDDAHDEGAETFTLTLSNARPAGKARLADASATGTIENTDTMPQAWTARFGRSVATHVLGALDERLEAASSGSWVQLAGRRLDGEADLRDRVQRLVPDRDLWADELATDPSQAMTFRDLLLGSAFHLASNDEDTGSGARLSAWGRVAASGFDGQSGRVSLDGTVTTATLGVDGAWDRLLSGVLVAYSEGDGSYAHAGLSGGELSSSLTSVHPYAAYSLSERVRLWGMVGYGSGALQLRLEEEGAMDTDLTMTMGALGVRGRLLDPAQAGGLELALRSDVLWMVMDSAAADNLAATEAKASRLRLVLEGSRPVALEDGGTFTPSLELGLRHDGGDAETGSGLEVGGSLAYASSWGLSIEASVRALLAHEAEDYTEWGAGGALRFDPGRRGRGLTASIAPAWGSASGGVQSLWGQAGVNGQSLVDPLATAAGRLDAELGYGLAALSGRGLLTPYARVALTEGADQAWHLGTRLELAEILNLSLEAGRRSREGERAAHEVALLANLGW